MPGAWRRAVMKLIIVSLAVLLGANLKAPAQITLSSLRVGNEIYTNATITSINATEIYFFHSRGLANAKLKNLEPALQTRFHYDPIKAEASEQLQEDANARYVQAAVEGRLPGQSTQPALVSDAAPGAPRSFLNAPVPTLVVQKWLTGQPDVNGKFVLIHFWASDCAPCLDAVPKLNQLSQQFRERLVIIGLSDEPEESMQKLTDPPIAYTLAIDTGQRLIRALELQHIPYALLVNPRGIVRYEGHPDALSAEMLQAIFAETPR